MQKHFFTSYFLLFSLFTQAQTLTQTVKGQVTDDESGAPIIGATIRIANTNPPQGAITDVNGFFRIEEVAVGRQSIEVSYLGYEPQLLQNILVNSGKEVVLNVEMVESLEQLAEVIVTAKSESGEPLNDMASVSAISISVEETSRYAATYDDPARAALTFAGVQTGGDDLLNEIVIRGNSPKGILWRLEGVEIQNPNHFASIGSSAGGISMLSSNVLANSDFFTGAYTSQYGNATSGVFDLKMRKGNYDTHEHAVRVGLLGVGLASEGPLSKSSNASYLFNYRYSTLGLLGNLGIDILGEQEDVLFQDLSFKVFVPTKKWGTFSIWGLAGANAYEFLPNLELGEAFYDEEKQQMGVFGVTNIVYVSKDAYFETILSGSSQTFSNQYDSLRQVVYFEEDFKETQLRFSTLYNQKLSASSTIRTGLIVSQLGFDLLNRDYDPVEETYSVPIDDDGSAQLYQTYFNWKYRPYTRFTINSGFHVTSFALNKDVYVEPRLGAQYQTNSGTITGGFGMHSRMETLAIYTSTQYDETLATTIQKNRNLAFTKAMHGVLGYQTSVFNKALRLKTEVYYQHLYDVPVWSDENAIEDEYLEEAFSFSALNSFDGYTSDKLVNDGTGTNYGVEATLEKPLKNGLYGLATLSLYESKYKGADGVERDTRFNGGFIFNVIGGKEFKVGAGGNNTVGINFRYISAGGKREAPIDIEGSRSASQELRAFTTVRDFSENFSVRLNTYQRIDIGLSYRKNSPKTTSVIALNVQNVFARENELYRFYWDGAILSETQLGFFPNLSFQLEF